MKVKLILAVAFVLGIFVAAFLFSGIMSYDVAEPVAKPVVEPVILSEVEVVSNKETPYETGYRTGYRAFQLQMGQEAPRLVKYTSSSETVESLGEDASKGYVDGYHRAADSYVCPRCPN